MEPEMFRGFGVPSFEVLEIWWVESKIHTFLASVCFPLALLVCNKAFVYCRLCAGYRKKRRLALAAHVRDFRNF